VADETFRRLDALISVGLRLARSAPSGRVALAQVERAIELEWVPLPWGETVVAELHAAAEASREPIPFRQVERVLRDAWDAKATDELDSLEPEPVAVTPGAQVHRGELDGSPVAVKVLRPGLAASVRQDLALLEGLLAPLSAAFPAVDAAALLREVRERVLDELDLEAEAAAQRQFHRALRRHPFLVVPAPITALAHPSVSVSQWIDGAALRDAPDPDDAAAKLIAFSLGAHRFGLIHADIDPDDLRVLDDGRLAILDFGAVARVRPERVELSVRVLDAFAADDADGLGTVLEQLGLLPASLGPVALEVARHALGPLASAEPHRLDSAAVIAARDRLLEQSDALAQLIGAGSLAPEDLWPSRGLAQTFAAIARVGATGSWLTLARDALRGGWDAVPAGA
jgi:predicted unusual protein kinase regulating ubiquinone biosynthesis (AarF/ABC1/UbiB family)